MLADILRDTIDQAGKFKRGLERPPQELIDAYATCGDLSKEDTQRIESFFLSSCLKAFLDSKEHLVIPDEAWERATAEYVGALGDLEVAFAYEDFYAYQSVDRLDDIVRRAFKVRNVFAKHRPPSEVLPLCREAYQCYLHGFHTASIAAIRSVVEVALKHILGVELGGPRDNALMVLSEEGLRRGLYDKIIKGRIDKLFSETSRVIHAASRGTAVSEHNNLHLLGLAQEVLEALVRGGVPRASQRGRR